MSYLLDTNVISEMRQRVPNPLMLSWIEKRPVHSLYISVLTLGEIRKGCEQLAASARRTSIEDWLEHEVPAFFNHRVLPIDASVADRWGHLAASVGRTVSTIDSLLAATALHHRLTVVTRNVRDFQFPGLDVVNPWLPIQ